MLRFNLSNKTLKERYFVLKKKPWFIRSYKALLTKRGAIVRSRFLFEPNYGFVWLVNKKEMYKFLGMATPSTKEINELYNEETQNNSFPFSFEEKETFGINVRRKNV